MMPHYSKIRASFAYVYDVLYGGDTAFLHTQLDFLTAFLGQTPGPLLDIGCGTGIHVAALSDLGRAVVGVDNDPLMLQMARSKLPAATLVLADMHHLPFRRTFSAALCLESPLAYLLDPASLHQALLSIWGALAEGGRLVVDVFDYPATLGTHPARPTQAQFEQAGRHVSVRESHRFDPETRQWTMRQEFHVAEQDEQFTFEAVHRLAIRSTDEYAAALQAAGFTILEALNSYPNMPEALRDERRVILLAHR